MQPLNGTNPRPRTPTVMRRTLFALAGAFAGLTAPRAAQAPALRMEILVNGAARPEFSARGARYVEALAGAEYSIRLTNTTGSRIAVALAVDGLNSIDGRHTGARDARKWVLGPWESAEISGWQVSGERSRAFFFTSEARSYGAWLGDTRNLGNIEAVVFREKLPPPPPPVYAPVTPESNGPAGEREESGRAQEKAAAPSASAAPAPRPRGDARGGGHGEPKPSDDYAATGIGRDQYHPVESVALELEPRPFSSLRIRYEFRPELIRLGVLPPPFHPRPDRMGRRERGGGFGWAPEPRDR